MTATIGALTSTSSFALRPSVVVTVIEDGAVLLDLDTKYFFRLNASAWALVSRFECDGVTRDQLAAHAVALGAPDGDAAIDGLLFELESKGLIEAAAAGAGDGLPVVSAGWVSPTIVCQSEPLQSVVTSAFDPSVPLAE